MGVRKVGGNFLGVRKGEISTEFLTCPQERVLVVVEVLDVGFVVVVGVDE